MIYETLPPCFGTVSLLNSVSCSQLRKHIKTAVDTRSILSLLLNEDINLQLVHMLIRHSPNFLSCRLKGNNVKATK